MFMSAVATNPANTDQPSRAGHLISLVRRLIDYAKELAATFQQGAATASLASRARSFGTGDIALILSRITSGLLRAQVLEERLVRSAARLDAAPSSKAAALSRSPRATLAIRPTKDDVTLDRLPTADQIAAEARRRPIGAVIADICRDLGITPSHPLWRELSLVIIRHGGNLAALFKDICHRLFPLNRPASPLVAQPGPLGALPAPASTGPP